MEQLCWESMGSTNIEQHPKNNYNFSSRISLSLNVEKQINENTCSGH